MSCSAMANQTYSISNVKDFFAVDELRLENYKKAIKLNDLIKNTKHGDDLLLFHCSIVYSGVYYFVNQSVIGESIYHLLNPTDSFVGFLYTTILGLSIGMLTASIHASCRLSSEKAEFELLLNKNTKIWDASCKMLSKSSYFIDNGFNEIHVREHNPGALYKNVASYCKEIATQKGIDPAIMSDYMLATDKTDKEWSYNYSRGFKIPTNYSIDSLSEIHMTFHEILPCLEDHA